MAYCTYCGQNISDQAQLCPACGHPALPLGASPKSRLAAAALCFFFGCLGIHRFYVAKIGTGVLMILTLGGLGVWALIDFVIILCGKFKDKQGQVLAVW